MYSKLIVLSVAAACVFAAPPTDVVPLEKRQPTVIPIISQSDELEANGTYKFSYETGNGIKREEEAYEKVLPKAEGRNHSSSNEGGESDEDSNEIHVQRGSYSYTAPDGTVISLSYIADENGFQPIGKHLTRVPVPAQSVDALSEKAGRALKSNKVSSDNKASASEAKSEAKPSPASESTPAAAPESTPTAVPESTSAPATESTSTPAEKTEDSLKESTTEGITTNAASGENSAETASTIIPSQPTSAESTEAPISTTAPEQVTTSSNEQQTTSTPITEAAAQSADVKTPSTDEPKSASEEATTVSL